MTSRIRKAKPEQTQTEEVVEEKPVKSDEALKDELDELLDEIDSVLEENAETFVNSYIQKGANDHCPVLV